MVEPPAVRYASRHPTERGSNPMHDGNTSFDLSELQAAARLVHRVVQPTPQWAWPKLRRRAGCTVWVKHENHTPTGAFKVRGGIVYLNRLGRSGPRPAGIVTATRGNHGQSISFAAARAGIPATIYVPFGNSPDQNASMASFGANVVEYGKDLDAVYVGVGMGSGICGLMAARDVLGLKTEIVGVCAVNAPATARSFAAGRPVETAAAQTFADGIATREPNADAIGAICRGAARIVMVSEDEIAGAMRAYYDDTHQIAEGAGAAPLAALLQERERMANRNVALILSGGNIERERLLHVLGEQTPGAG